MTSRHRLQNLRHLHLQEVFELLERKLWGNKCEDAGATFNLAHWLWSIGLGHVEPFRLFIGVIA